VGALREGFRNLIEFVKQLHEKGYVNAIAYAHVVTLLSSSRRRASGTGQNALSRGIGLDPLNHGIVPADAGSNSPNTMESSMRQLIGRFTRDERGANAMEYALVLILVAFAIVGGAALLGTNINSLFNQTGVQVGNVSVPNI